MKTSRSSSSRSSISHNKHSKTTATTPSSSSSSTTTRIIILGGRSQHHLPTTEGSGMKIDRAHPPTLHQAPIFTTPQWNTFCDTINNSLQLYNVVIKTHSKKVVARLLILPMASFTSIAVILILFGRPFLGLGIFIATVGSSFMVCLYDRCKADRAYVMSIENLRSVVEKINREAVLLEDVGVVLSVVLTGPTSSRSDYDDDDNQNDQDVSNGNSEKWRNNSIANVYIECKRITHSSRHHDNDSELFEKRQKQPMIDDAEIVYDEEDSTFSC